MVGSGNLSAGLDQTVSLGLQKRQMDAAERQRFFETLSAVRALAPQVTPDRLPIFKGLLSDVAKAYPQFKMPSDLTPEAWDVTRTASPSAAGAFQWPVPDHPGYGSVKAWQDAQTAEVATRLNVLAGTQQANFMETGGDAALAAVNAVAALSGPDGVRRTTGIPAGQATPGAAPGWPGTPFKYEPSMAQLPLEAITIPQDAPQEMVNTWGKWGQDIMAIAREEGVEPGLLAALIAAESGGNPDSVSAAGAIGLGQLMPATAQELGVDPGNPLQNIRGAAKYLRQQIDANNGDIGSALAAYNSGPGTVAKAGGIPDIPETKDYVRRVRDFHKYVSVDATGREGMGAANKIQQVARSGGDVNLEYARLAAANMKNYGLLWKEVMAPASDLRDRLYAEKLAAAKSEEEHDKTVHEETQLLLNMVSFAFTGKPATTLESMQQAMEKFGLVSVDRENARRIIQEGSQMILAGRSATEAYVDLSEKYRATNVFPMNNEKLEPVISATAPDWVHMAWQGAKQMPDYKNWTMVYSPADAAVYLHNPSTGEYLKQTAETVLNMGTDNTPLSPAPASGGVAARTADKDPGWVEAARRVGEAGSRSSVPLTGEGLSAAAKWGLSELSGNILGTRRYQGPGSTTRMTDISPDYLLRLGGVLGGSAR